MATAPVLFLELNEVNFAFLERYVAQGHLPEFGRLIAEHGVSRTMSETAYDELEPWIQWVTAHTGLSYAEHGVYRLGDIVKTDIPQIWEELEAAGLRVGAISPMNAKHRLRNAAFFLPDPWTDTEIVAPAIDRRMFDAIRQAVNENAEGKLTISGLMALATGAAKNAFVSNYAAFVGLVMGSKMRPWNKALILDLLLGDVFIRSVARTRPHFASLFLNAGAHIQHHYMFNSQVYDGQNRNPAWYVDANRDPLFDVYALYDRLISRIARRFPQHRLMLGTGLHQEPYGEVTYYWRLKDHASYLALLRINDVSVQPRMSRDFLVECGNAERARDIAARLEAARASDGGALFAVDNRGDDLFVMFVYPNDIPDTLTAIIDGRDIGPIRPHVAFVAIKNGEHDGTGYFLDTGAVGGEEFSLAEIPARIKQALAVEPVRPQRAA